jgi:hypothetical protein
VTNNNIALSLFSSSSFSCDFTPWHCFQLRQVWWEGSSNLSMAAYVSRVASLVRWGSCLACSMQCVWIKLQIKAVVLVRRRWRALTLVEVHRWSCNGGWNQNQLDELLKAIHFMPNYWELCEKHKVKKHNIHTLWKIWSLHRS